jgi:hypothetical protein
MFYAIGIIFGCTEGIRSHFHVLRTRTHFRLYRGRQGPYFMLSAPGLVLGDIECVPSPVFMLRAPRLVLGITEGVRSNFHVLRY